MAAFQGLEVLVVEDEQLVGMLVEAMLEDLGCVPVRTVGSVPEALEAVERVRFDLALLDVNLAGKEVFPVAEALSQKDIPFVFSSGYGPSVLPERFKGRPVIPKPFRLEDLEQAIRTAVDAS